MVYKTDQPPGRTPLDSILYSHTTLTTLPMDNETTSPLASCLT